MNLISTFLLPPFIICFHQEAFGCFLEIEKSEVRKNIRLKENKSVRYFQIEYDEKIHETSDSNGLGVRNTIFTCRLSKGRCWDECIHVFLQGYSRIPSHHSLCYEVFHIYKTQHTRIIHTSNFQSFASQVYGGRFDRHHVRGSPSRSFPVIERDSVCD